MTAFISSNTNKTAVSTHLETPKVDSAKAKATAPVQAADVLNKAPANKSNTSPAAVVALGNSKTLDHNLYTKTGELQKSTNAAKAQKTVAKDETPDSGDSFVAGKGDVIVDVKNSDSGYDNKIFWSTDNFKTKHYIGVDNNTDSVNIGKFAEGTKIDFGIENGEGQFFRTGSAANNSDNIKHATVTKTAEGTQYGFEDLNGGGDNDFNDAIFNVRNAPAATDTPKPAPDNKVKPEINDAKKTVSPKKELQPKVEVSPKTDQSNADGKPVGVKFPPETPPTTDKLDTKSESKNKIDLGVLPKTNKDVQTTDTKNAKVEPKPAPKPAPKDAQVEPTSSKPPITGSKNDTTVKPVKTEGNLTSKVDGKTKADNNVTNLTTKTDVKTDTKNSTNRSGLGDGTNPGQGDGRVNATNTGTNNPGKLSAYSTKPAAGSQLKVAV